MPRQLIGIFMLSALLALAGGSPLVAQSADAAFLTVFDLQPAPVSPLALDQPITFFFNRRVDCRDAEAALRWTPAIAGELSCDEFSLTFTPQEPYRRETSYTFAFEPPLVAKDGARLLENYSASFVTVGYLEAAEVFPSADAGPVPADSAITIVFDRPIVPLALSLDAVDLPQPLSLAPAVDGSGEWINSALYVFTPAEPLRSDTAYTATIDRGLTAVDGAVFERPFRWTFRTAALSVLSIDPPPGAPDLPLKPKLQVRFNQTLDRDVVERAFYLREVPDDGNDSESGAFEWADDGQGFAFSPDEPLELDADYEAGFSAELAPDLRLSDLAGGNSWRYHSVPAPAISATEPRDGADNVDRGGFSLVFASAMNINSLPERITIEPAPELPPRYFYSDWSKRYTVSFDAQPSTAYTIRIAPGMEDIYGNAIAEALTLHYVTAPRAPELSLNVPGPVGFYDANRDQTSLYLNHRGLESIDLALSRVPLEVFVARLTSEENYDPASSFAPRDDQLIRRWRIQPEAPENVAGYELLTLSDDGSLEPGLYFLEATAPGMDRFAWRNKHFLNVATAVITVKQATDRLTIWALDVDSGAPISGEDIVVYGADGKRLGAAATDDNGIARVDIPYTRDLYTPFVAVLSTGERFGIGYTNWSNGAEPWNFGYRFSWFPRAYQTYLYTDRPVYRTGQPVYFRGIVRSKDDVVYMPAPFERMPVTIRDALGEIVYERDLALNDFGTFSGRFDIAPDASLGAYSLSVDLPAEDAFRAEGGGIAFLVAEYRLPEYQATLSTETPQIVQGAEAEFEVEGRYFFGGAVSDAQVDYRVYSTPYDFKYTGDGRYDFGDSSAYDSAGQDFHVNRVISEGVTATDADGSASFVLAGDLPGEPRSQTWRVEAAMSEEGGQAIYGRSEVVVHQALLYVGLSPERAVSVAGEDSRVNLIAVDWDSQPLANQRINIEVVERRWISLQEQDPATGAVAWTWDIKEIPITTDAVTADAGGEAAFVFQPPNGGAFKISATARDSAGNLARSATYIWVSSADYVSWRQENDSTIRIVPDKTDYNVGERAKVLIASPFQGQAEALVTIERGDVLSAERISLSSNSHIYEFEILPQHAPNIFVNVFLVKPANDPGHLADWRVGMTQLQVDIERKALHIDIRADRDVAAPQDEVEYHLRVTDYRGDPVVAEVGIGLTDLAALSLAERNSQALLESFYGPQELSIRTSSSLVVNADAYSAGLSTEKGGGGGLFEAGIVDLRGEFIDTAYWNPSVITDAQGEATISLRLPDNLTTWRLDARALTEGRAGRLLVGEQTFDLRSTRPLLIRPVTPRFFVVGDQVQLAAVVNNNTEGTVAALVSLENLAGLDASAAGGLIQDLMIPAGGRQRVTWHVAVDDVSRVAPRFLVRSLDGEYADASISPVSVDADGTLPVYRYEARETVGTAGALLQAGTRSEAVLLPRAFGLGEGKLRISLDKSLAAVTNESLTYLEYDATRFSECNSAVVSRFLPNIVSYRALEDLSLAKPELKSKLEALVSEGLQTLYARQLANGGWSWCGYPEADVMTTAFALIGLAEAERQVYPVDANVVRLAQRFLRRQFIAPTLEFEPWQLNRQAFILFALAESGAPDIARSATLYEHRARLNLDAIAFLAMTLHRINSADYTRLDALTQIMLNRAVARASVAFFEEPRKDPRSWSTEIRSTALALNALLKIRPESDQLPNIVRHLVAAREGRGYWGSPQENAWSITALTNWMRFSGELQSDYVYSVSVNGLELLQVSPQPEYSPESHDLIYDLATLEPRESNIIEIQRGAGAGALYYTARVDVNTPVDQVEAISKGIEVSRAYTLLEDEARAEAHSAAIGDTVQVRLRISVPNTLRYVVIEDFFPAGAEAVNPDLAISPQLGVMPGGELIDPRDEGWGWWYFDRVEFHDERAVIYASVLPPGVYEYVYAIRPSIAGEFKVIPPVARARYFPEVYGRGDGARFSIVEAPNLRSN